MDVKLTVGLEIHVQLATASKMFCGCKLGFNEPANSHVCPVCLGLPGALPVMNMKAYEYSVRTALALNCEIARFTKWDRKSYYYPDMPKNYQISQYDLPLSFDGYMEIPLEGGAEKKVRILRAHLEEDAGKNLHEGSDYSRVDLNRAGTPLLEIVTEPDLNSAAECRVLAQELQKLVQFLGVSEGNMQMGHMRFEPNINLQIVDDDGREYRTPICEVKNLNSFRALEKAVSFEEWRQMEAWRRDHDFTLEKLGKQNRGWNDVREETVFQREKEEAHDYRYFPEPDLAPVELSEGWLEEIRGGMGELPLAMKKRFMEEYGLDDYDAGVLTGDRGTGEFFDGSVRAGGEAKRVANLVTQYGLKVAHERGCGVGELGVSVERIAQLAELVDGGSISASAAVTIFEKMLDEEDGPEALAEKYNLIQQSDAEAIEALVDEVIAANAAAVAEVRRGGKKAKKSRGFLMGQVMQKSKGQANPKVAGDLLDEKLGEK